MSVGPEVVQIRCKISVKGVLAVTYHQDFLVTYGGDRLKVEARHAVYRCQKDTTTVSVMDPI